MQANNQQAISDLRASVSELHVTVSDLRSTVSTLADIVSTHEGQLEESARLHEESRQRFDRFVEQAERDRALMLQLIQRIGQGGNGN